MKNTADNNVRLQLHRLAVVSREEGNDRGLVDILPGGRPVLQRMSRRLQHLLGHEDCSLTGGARGVPAVVDEVAYT